MVYIDITHVFYSCDKPVAQVCTQILNSIILQDVTSKIRIVDVFGNVD
jgi:hypothetical protein